MKRLLFLVILLITVVLITSAIQERNNYTQDRPEKNNISFGPEILLSRKEIKNPDTDTIYLSKAFMDSCISWYRKFDCDNPVHIEDPLKFSDPFSDSLLVAKYIMNPEFNPADSAAIQTGSKVGDRCINEIKINNSLNISFSILADCGGQDACWEINNRGNCHLFSRVYFHRDGLIKYGMEINRINMLDMRPDLISVFRNDTIISLYGIQQIFADGGKNMQLLIVRKSIHDLLTEFEQVEQNRKENKN